MKLEKFKEKDNKKIGVIVFTLICLFLISVAILYRTFAIFEVKTNQNVINGEVQDMGDLRFMVYVGDELQKDIPNKESDYSLDTSKSYCEDITDSSKRSHISWNQEKWSIEIKDIGTTKTKCYLYFDKLYVDSTLNGAIPDLGNELVAITFDETNGHALKADLTKEWYDYSNQKWANAVILKSKEDYEVNEEIPESNIESYFVWIPRYEYEIWNGEEETNKFTAIEADLGVVEDTTQKKELNHQQAINIRFVNKNVPIVTGSTKGSWLTHPAFVSFDCNGFWVGKFETGYNQNDDVTSLDTSNWTSKEAQKDVIASDRVIIKPNVYSWRGIRIAHAFYTTYNYKRELDSHMMKNMEWGALAYLANSKYGLCKNILCQNIMFNNNANFVTGFAAKNQPTCGYTGNDLECHKTDNASLNNNGQYSYNYNDPNSTKASTTGDYYGVFDMAGGAWEYVMGVMQTSANDLTPTSGRSSKYNSGFIGKYSCYNCDSTTDSETTNGYPWPNSNYYDTYNYNTKDGYYFIGKFGDATKEVGPFYLVTSANSSRKSSSFYGDMAYIVTSGYPWFIRGGDYLHGSGAGLMAFSNTFGHAQGFYSFRVILTP